MLAPVMGWAHGILIAPEESAPPEEGGLWILDQEGLTESERAERRRRYGLAAEQRGASIEDGAGNGGAPADLAGLLRAGLRGWKLQLGLPPLMRYVPAVRRFVAGRVGDRFGARAAFCMELVFDELYINAIEHGAPLPARIRCAVEIDGSVLRYKLRNRLQEPHAGEADARMSERVQEFDDSGTYLGERGRGLFLVGSMMDGLSIQEDDEGVQIETWKDLKAYNA